MTNLITFKQNFIHSIPTKAGTVRLMNNPLIAVAAGAAFGALVTRLVLVFKNHTRPSAAKLETQAVPKPLLRVEKINIYDYALAAKVASAWKIVAKEKGKQADESKEQLQFINCEYISQLIGNILSCPNSAYDVYVCKDEEGNYQAMMALAIHAEHVYINLLVTNPINIRSSVNTSERKKVPGAGTALLKEAEQIAVENGKSAVTLRPLEFAIPFYEKNGFTSAGFGMRKTVHKIEDQITPLLHVA